jgi:hypothetical protein
MGDCGEEQIAGSTLARPRAGDQKKSKGVYLLFIEVNALDVSSGADGVRSPAGRRLWVPPDGRYHLVIGQLVPQKAA